MVQPAVLAHGIQRAGYAGRLSDTRLRGGVHCVFHLAHLVVVCLGLAVLARYAGRAGELVVAFCPCGHSVHDCFYVGHLEYRAYPGGRLPQFNVFSSGGAVFPAFSVQRLVHFCGAGAGFALDGRARHCVAEQAFAAVLYPTPCLLRTHVCAGGGLVQTPARRFRHQRHGRNAAIGGAVGLPRLGVASSGNHSGALVRLEPQPDAHCVLVFGG